MAIMQQDAINAIRNYINSGMGTNGVEDVGSKGTYTPFGKENNLAIRKELRNVPRMDIDGRRYGNTISDDMFSVKNPANRENRHTPVSYDYLEDIGRPNSTVEIEYPDNLGIPALGTDFRDWGVSRKKNITDNATEWGLYDGVYDTAVENYDSDDNSQQYVDWYRNRIKEDTIRALNNQQANMGYNDSLSDDVRYIKSGGRTGHGEGEQLPRFNADYDPYLGTLVNYEDMSRNTLEQLVKMGVNRPNTDDLMEFDEENGSDTLNNMIKLYQYYLDNFAAGQAG